MTVNHSSVLSVKYFESYFKLVISSRNYKAQKAKEFIIETFFKGNVKLYGEDTCRSFYSAYSRLRKDSE